MGVFWRFYLRRITIALAAKAKGKTCPVSALTLSAQRVASPLNPDAFQRGAA